MVIAQRCTAENWPDCRQHPLLTIHKENLVRDRERSAERASSLTPQAADLHRRVGHGWDVD